MDNAILQIRDFADKAHGDQTRRYTPDRYIVHPTRVMEICRQYTNDRTMLAAALLHDVLEDTEVTKDNIEDFLRTVMDQQQAQRTIKLVVELTDIYVKKNFPQMNRRKRKIKEADRLGKASPEAQTIKYADIIDNSGEIAAHDPDFAERFLDECRNLLAKMTKGNAELRQRAIDTVQANIAQLKKS
jgi:guanosine-3',5'-bis(diphosphate) 3'-pyrophosphohydrolase